MVLCEWGRFRILDGGVYNAKGAPVRAIFENNAIARGPAPKEFLTFSYPVPKFDDLMRNPGVQALVKEQNLSVDQMREVYEREAPKQIQIIADESGPSNMNDAAKESKTRPTLRRPLKRTPAKPIEPQPAERQLDQPQLKLDEKAATVITRFNLTLQASS
mgnify:CR=1 FL=1